MIAACSGRRLQRWLVTSLAMVLVFLVAPAGTARAAEPGVPVPPDTGLTEKGVGAISAADRDFVVKVRLAGLWEIPASNMAQDKDKTSNERIWAIGAAIGPQHVKLDELAIEAADTLGLKLPNQPNDQQLGWLAEMKAAKGTVFDQIYIDRLRAAHGAIFPAIATIRGSTRNDAVRKLAQHTNQFVLTHLTLLESSGMVNYGDLPTAPPPKAANGGPVPVDENMIAAASSGELPGMKTPVILIVLAAALVAGVVTTMRLVRTR